MAHRVKAAPLTLPGPICVEMFPGTWRSLRDTTYTTETPRRVWLSGHAHLSLWLDFFPGVVLRDPHYERPWIGRALLTRLSVSALEHGKREEMVCGYVRVFRRGVAPVGVKPRLVGVPKGLMAYGFEDGSVDWEDTCER